jgi:hypothetical protein
LHLRTPRLKNVGLGGVAKKIKPLEPRLKLGVMESVGLAVFARTDTACSAEGTLALSAQVPF